MPAAMIMAGILTGGAKTPSVPPRAIKAVTLTRGIPMRRRMAETTAPKAKMPSARAGESRGKHDEKHQKDHQDPRFSMKVEDQIPDDRIQPARRLLHIDEDRGRIDDQHDVHKSEGTLHQMPGEIQRSKSETSPPMRAARHREGIAKLQQAVSSHISDKRSR